MYKNKYLICLYDEDDLCIGVFESVRELAATYGLTMHKAKMKVSNAWSRHGMSVIDSKVCKMMFVEDKE